MQRYAGRSIVVKFGGNAMGQDEYIEAFAKDMVLLRQVGATPVVVHGGGPQIGAMLDQLRIESNFVNGLRITDHATIGVVEMVLAGAVNKAIVAAIAAAGGKAVGISGKDASLIMAHKASAQTPKDFATAAAAEIDLGFVGEPAEVNPAVIHALSDHGMIPVIAPIAMGYDGHTYNINADTAAGAVAGAIEAARLLMLTNVPGVKGSDEALIPELTISQARQLISEAVIQGGMIPKVETCIAALEAGAEAAVVLNGTEAHAVLVELFTEHGIGTLIRRDDDPTPR